jgi:hypothetical protein
MKPHKHAELIKAWADGAEIECRDCRVWYHAKDPRWQEDMEYRIKSESKPDIVKSFILEANPVLGLRLNEISGFQKQPHEDWIRILFDGETAKMKSAEVLK